MRWSFTPWGVKMLGASYCAVSGNVVQDCYQGIGLCDHPPFRADCAGNSITGNTILNAGSPGSFGVPGAGRVRYSGPCGIDVPDASDFNAISANVILDTQPVKTMRRAIQRNNRPHNVYSGNVESGEYTAPARLTR